MSYLQHSIVEFNSSLQSSYPNNFSSLEDNLTLVGSTSLRSFNCLATPFFNSCLSVLLSYFSSIFWEGQVSWGRRSSMSPSDVLKTPVYPSIITTFLRFAELNSGSLLKLWASTYRRPCFLSSDSKEVGGQL